MAGSAPSQLKGLVIRGSIWTIAAYGATQVLRLGGNLIVAKLLFPGAFGVAGLVLTFVQGLAMFSDIGIGPSIIQSRRGEELVFLNTAWTLEVVRGFLLWLVSLAAAAPFADLYGDPQLAPLIRVSALTSIIAGFTSTRLSSAGRRVAVARIRMIELASMTIGIAAMVVFCFFSRSVWGVVLGGLVGTLAKTVLSHTALPGERNRLTFDRGAARELMLFGRWIFVSTSLTFLALQVDRLLLGKLVPIEELGVYNIASGLSALAPSIAVSLAASVLFPLLAHHSRTDTQAYARALYAGRAIILQGSLFVLAGLALLSPVFFRVLYDVRYAGAAWMTPLLVVPTWFSMLMISADRAVLAMGKSKSLAIANACALIGKLAACVAGFQFAGLPGFILGLAVGNIAGHIPIVFALRRLGMRILKQDLAYTALAGAAIGGGVLLQRWVMSELDGPWRTLAEVGLAVVVLVPLGVWAAKHARQAMSRR